MQYFLHKTYRTYRATASHCLWPGNCTRVLSGNVDIDQGSRAIRGVAACGLCWRWRCEFNLPRLRIFFYLCFREYLQMSIELVVFAVVVVVCYYLCCCLFYSCCFCVLCRCYGSARFRAFPPCVLLHHPSLSPSLYFVRSFFGKFVYWQQQREQQQEQQQQQRQWQPPLTKTRTADQQPAGHETCAPIFIIIFIVVAVAVACFVVRSAIIFILITFVHAMGKRF